MLTKRVYSERPPRDEYVLTQAGYGENLARYIDEETGREIEPIGVDAVAGAKLGSRALRMGPANPQAQAREHA
ncbi:MAG: hypothetical protein ACT4NV_19870 [Rhodoferax sp.]